MDKSRKTRKNQSTETTGRKIAWQKNNKKEIENVRILSYRKPKKWHKPVLKWGLFALLLIGIIVAFLLLNQKAQKTIYETFFGENVYSSTKQVGETKIHFIDVGQGDCILVEHLGHFAMIDAGDGEADNAILSYLDNIGVKKLDYFIMSHPHSDHVGSMRDVMKNIEIETIILPDFSKGVFPTTSVFKNILKDIKKYNIPTHNAKNGTIYTFGDATFTVIASGADEPDKMNNTSIAMMFEINDFKFFTAGDAEKLLEKQLLSSEVDLSADLLKVSHHGSITSSMPEFIAAVSPKVAVISCSLNNRFGHPNQNTLNTLRDNKVPYWTTAYAGNVVICVKDNNIYVVKTNDGI